MPVRFDIIGLVNRVRMPPGDENEPIEDNPLDTAETNSLLKMDSIGLKNENNNQTVRSYYYPG